jgi:hypothetical protein
VDSARKKKRKLPQWYLDEPDEVEGAAFYFEAYRDLVTCRPLDGAIPWDKVTLYADRKGLEPDNADLLWEIIRRMDTVERKWNAENLELETPHPSAEET